MEKIKLVVEVIKVLLKRNRPLTTSELQRELYYEGVLSSPDSRVERRKLLRALASLKEFNYVTDSGGSGGRSPKRWSVNNEKFKFLSSYTREEVVALSVLLLFFPRHYRSLPFFRKAFDALTRFEKELTEEERELLKFTFERVPNPNERGVELDYKLVEKIFSTLLENRGAFVTYKGRSFKLFPVKFFTYNGLFYIGAFSSEGYRNYLVSRIEFWEPVADRITLEEKMAKVEETFKIPDESPFLFKTVFPHGYATDRELEGGIKFFPSQVRARRTEEGIEVELVGFTGKRFASWFLMEKALKLVPPDENLLAFAKLQNLKRSYRGLSYELSENIRRFRAFKEKGLELAKMRVKLFGGD